MQCPNGCSSAMQTLHVERIYHRKGEPVVIRNLEIYVCLECGCEAMPLHTARLVENVLKGEIPPVGQFSAPLYQSAQ